MHTPRKDCKHIKAVKQSLAVGIAAPVYLPPVPTKPMPTMRPAQQPAPVVDDGVVFGGFVIRKQRSLDAVVDVAGQDGARKRRKL
jgi:hypothetical protein